MKTGIGCLLIIVFFVNSLSADNSSPWNAKAARAVHLGQRDLAFMYYRSFLTENSADSPRRQKALFAVAEYYFLNSDFNQAQEYFEDYLSKNEDKIGALFAHFYLWRLAQIRQKKTEMIAQEEQIKGLLKHVYIFNSVKEYVFVSPFDRVHKARYDIQKVEFYVEDKFVAEISY